MTAPAIASLVRALGVVGLSLLAASAAGCGGEAVDPKNPASAKSSGGGDGKGIQKGDKAPAFTLESLNGAGKVSVGTGKVTIVDFWATWCEPCKKSFPKYQELYVKYKASGLEIVAVSVDEEEKKGSIGDFAKSHGGAKFPVGWDDGKKIADKWKPEGMPSAYIVGKDGVVKHVHKGYHDGEEAEIEKEIKALF